MATGRILSRHEKEVMQMMTRRSFFLTGGAATAALVATGGLGKSRRLFAQGTPAFDPALVTTATSMNASTVANVFNGYTSSGDFYGSATSQVNVAANFASVGADEAWKQAFATVTPDQVNLGNMNINQFTAQIQIYAPTFQLSDAQQIFQYFYAHPESVAASLAALQSGGITPILYQCANGFNNLATIIASVTTTNLASPFGSRPLVNADAVARGMKPNNLQPNMRPPQLPPHGNGGHYNCADDALALMGFGVGGATIGVMCLISIIGFACAPVVGVMVGVVGGAWSVGHAMVCGLS